MTTLTTFTSYDEIRAVLGVSDEELEDLTLALPMYHSQLVFRLDDISEKVVANFVTVAAIAESSRTAVQQKFYDLCRVFSAYGVAQNLLVSLALFSPQRVTDGKAETVRFDQFEDVKVGVDGMIGPLQKRLQAALAALDPTYSQPAAAAGFTIAISTGLARDPVTAST